MTAAAGLTGFGLSYSRKSLDWAVRDWSITSITATVGTSFGVFAAQYNRKSMGTIPVTTAQYPDGNGSEFTLYSHDVALGYAYRLPVGLALGASAKYYDLVETYSGPPLAPYFAWSTTPAYLFDFGLTYTLPRFHSQTEVEDSVTVGMSYQNIGTRWKLTYPVSTLDQTVHNVEMYTQLPEYFRIGLSYAMSVRPPEGRRLAPFAAVISGEFRSLQAPIPYPITLFGSGSGTAYPETSYWGLGLELTLYEILSLRGGAAWRPYSDAEGDRDRASLRYGAALHLPLQKVGVDFPLSVSVQYTVIPVSEPDLVENSSVNNGTFPVFSIDIRSTCFPW